MCHGWLIVSISGRVEMEGQIVAILQCKSVRRGGTASGTEESFRELSLPITGTYHACCAGEEGRPG